MKSENKILFSKLNLSRKHKCLMPFAFIPRDKN